MGIKKDQNKLRKENIEFLKKYIDNYFKHAFGKLTIKYNKIIQENVFDSKNKDEVYQYLKTEFGKLSKNTGGFMDAPLRFFSGVNIKNDKFTCAVEEMLKFSVQRQLVDDIYPLIEKQLENRSVSANFDFFRHSMQNTSEKVYIKYRLEKLEINKTELNENAKYLYLFGKLGFELFCYLDKNFKSTIYPTTKYTIIYFFIKYVKKGEYLKCSAEQYLEFVRTHCEDQLKNKNGQIKYSRLAFNGYQDERYKKHKLELIDLYRLFKISIK